MHLKKLSLSILSVAATTSSFIVSAEHANLPEINVIERGLARDKINLDISREPLPVSDTAALMKKVPGGAQNYNGQLSGQVNYRGLFGPRMNVQVDDMTINSGGPNWMDPPLHYAPTGLVKSFSAGRGISSVSEGSGIGGNVSVGLKNSEFTDSEDAHFDGDFTAQAHSVDDGYNVNGLLSLANQQHRGHVLLSRDDGDDYESDAGTVGGTSYDRNFYGLGYGFLQGDHQLSFDYQHVDTDNSGNAVLPLDMEFFDSDLYNGKYLGQWGNADVKGRLSYTDIEHAMNNFSLRPAPDFSMAPLPFFAGSDRRRVTANSQGLGYELSATVPLNKGTFSFGVDGQLDENNARVTDPDFAPFFVTNFNEAETDTFGFFGEIKDRLTQDWGIELGLRYEQVEMDAGVVDAFPAGLMAPAMSPPASIRRLRDGFNTRDRSRTDRNIDLVAKLNVDLNQQTTLDFGFARKTRSPSFIERYLWIPLEINAGLGDGNNYVGNPDLKPEVSHQFEIGLAWANNSSYISPRIHYRQVDDFIQGSAVTDIDVIRASTVNGDSTPLQFSNVDAELYGIDVEYSWQINPQWHIDGLLSYIRGKRRDIDDNLFRIAPPRATIAVTHERNQWFATFETILVARQDEISTTITGSDGMTDLNSEDETPGYTLFNLYGQYQLKNNDLTLSGGIENIFDRRYVDHLSGFNRVAGSSVALGDRLFGPGRNFYVQMNYQF